MLLNINNADGIREAMRMSYRKHRHLASMGHITLDDTPDHHIGLYGALATRYSLASHVLEPVLWAELVPFLLMNEMESVEALAEYVVEQEMPREADSVWLAETIARAFRNGDDERLLALASLAIANRVPWVSLLGSNVDLGADVEDEDEEWEERLQTEREGWRWLYVGMPSTELIDAIGEPLEQIDEEGGRQRLIYAHGEVVMCESQSRNGSLCVLTWSPTDLDVNDE